MTATLPRARAGFIRLANLVAGQNRPIHFAWNGQPAEFNFTALPASHRGLWALELKMGGHDFRAEISRLPELAWVSPTLAGIELVGLPDGLACALMEACFGEILAGLAKQGVDVTIVSVRPCGENPSPDESIAWNISRGSEAHWMSGIFSGDDVALDHLAALLNRVPIVSRDEASVPVSVQLVVGTTTLTVAEMKSLEVHDVIFADLGHPPGANGFALYAGTIRLGLGTVEEGSFVLMEPCAPPATAITEAEGLASLDEVDVALTFVSSQTSLTVGDLRGLAPGFHFHLPEAAAHGLTICAGGKAIGRGEPIEIGGFSGLRVTELFAAVA